MRRFVAASIVVAPIALVACRRDRREIGPAPERSSIVRAAPTATTSSLPSPSVTIVDGLVGWVGDDVTIDGELVVPKHEHIDEPVPGKTPMCLSISSRGEVVAYFAAPPTCTRVRATGRAFVIRGFTPKTHAAYAEVALDASSWSCR